MVEARTTIFFLNLFYTLISSFVRRIDLFPSIYRFISFYCLPSDLVWGVDPAGLVGVPSLCIFLIDNCLVHCFSWCSVLISSDISKVGVWKEAQKLSDPELSIQVPHLLDLVLASSAPSATTRYSLSWTPWRRWSQSKQGVSFMPACPLCIAMYLLELTEDALQKNTGCSAIDSALYGIRWAHKIAGLESPTEHPTVIAAAEKARRKLSKPVQPKQPLDLETVVKVAQYYNRAFN